MVENERIQVGRAKTNYWNAANISSGIPSAFGVGTFIVKER